MVTGLFVDNVWIILPIFFTTRMLIPIITADRGMKEAPTQEEMELFKDYRVHNITLATFVIAAILLILGLNRDVLGMYARSLLYLSFGMFSFILASYLLLFKPSHWVPYLGRTVELTGLIAIAIGFLELIATMLPHETALILAYTGFLVGILSIMVYELYFNIKLRYRFGRRKVSHYKFGSAVDRCKYCNEVRVDARCFNPDCPGKLIMNTEERRMGISADLGSRQNNPNLGNSSTYCPRCRGKFDSIEDFNTHKSYCR